MHVTTSGLADSWKVLPHGLIRRLAHNVFTVNGQVSLPIGNTTRRMTLVPLAGDRLAIFGAIALRAEEMVKLEALGRPSYLIVPGELTRLAARDVKAWKERYPDIVVVAPPALRRGLAKIVEVDATCADVGDMRVGLLVVPGTGERELAMTVTTEGGKALIVNSVVFNLPRARGLSGTLMRFFGFGPNATLPKLVRMRLVRDKAAVRAQLESWAKVRGLEWLVMTHGEPIEHPRATLFALARSLEAARGAQLLHVAPDQSEDASPHTKNNVRGLYSLSSKPRRIPRRHQRTGGRSAVRQPRSDQSYTLTLV